MKLKPSPFYARLGAGYGFVHAGQTDLAGSGIQGSQSMQGTTYAIELKPASFGSGAFVNAAAGYMITRNFGLELGAHAIVAPVKYTFSGSSSSIGIRSYSTTAQARLPVYIIPAMVLSSGNKLKVYGRLGLVLPVSDKLRLENRLVASYAGQTNDVITSELSSRFRVGMQGAAGMSYSLSEHLAIWAEATVISRNAYARRMEITGYTEDGVDMMPFLHAADRVTEFETGYTTNYPVNSGQPEKQPTFSIPYSSIGAGAGITYTF